MAREDYIQWENGGKFFLQERPLSTFARFDPEGAPLSSSAPPPCAWISDTAVERELRITINEIGKINADLNLRLLVANSELDKIYKRSDRARAAYWRRKNI